jgi:hypothetical protein
MKNTASAGSPGFVPYPRQPDELVGLKNENVQLLALVQRLAH